jgi:hypothetical protein
MLWRGNSYGKEKRWKDFLELLDGESKYYEGPLSRPAGHISCIWSHLVTNVFALLLFSFFYVHVHASYTAMALAVASNSANFFFLFFFFRFARASASIMSLTGSGFSGVGLARSRSYRFDFITTICRLRAPQEYERNEKDTM